MRAYALTDGLKFESERNPIRMGWAGPLENPYRTLYFHLKGVPRCRGLAQTPKAYLSGGSTVPCPAALEVLPILLT